ncbi:MAG: SET domain-containing protein-lysine N-methyltransferase [Burkholderiales bacterium]|nr:SET domain-containing protein-lysine N-methyltransferase [Burkholderiales bacterium]
MTAKTPRRKIEVRESGVHGRGVYAVAPIAAGARVIEYTGERISWDEAVERHPHDPAQPNHTFYFHLDTGEVIDALHGGNDARWINHACEPNCEAEELESDDGELSIQFETIRTVRAGDELFIDYGLVIDESRDPSEYACACGSAQCRGTMAGLVEER